MSGIAGIAQAGQTKLVNQMLDKMAHRGRDWREMRERQGTTFGMTGPKIQDADRAELKSSNLVRDRAGQGHFAQAEVLPGGFVLKRGTLGVRPLYYGWTSQDAFCFASEMKGLLAATRDIHELPNGHFFDGEQMNRYKEIVVQRPEEGTPVGFAVELRSRLETAVQRRIGDGNVGAWLSGGLDSSAIAALARPLVNKLHTFAIGLPGAPDLEYARAVAEFIHSDHHERVAQADEILSVLPDAIYALESFDALLVRSTVMNYLVAKTASEFVPAVFSGEGGDELFAGYEYLKTLDLADLPAELVDITNRLHNTALQRVDRCSSAFGTVAHVVFLDPDVVEYALKIPANLKLRNSVEKWILRETMKGLLPETVLQRRKAKFWEGAGVEDLLARYAEEKVSNTDFERERKLSDGLRLNTKEELYYYRIFREHFGEFDDLSWMGRTKGSPVA
ncbi:MAG TPA: asparagine synthase-related protein [Anaerolineales bacterium]|nr:asparagine synthase-related protein [Anaerolineales bacterium]